MEKIALNNKTILVTGAARFVGSNLVITKDYAERGIAEVCGMA